ncbi:hypothetical protein [Nocardioides sp. CER19]|uniref:hypothetical protein n=1 Tax=Nocardioides sp. CER19 TaxID=3038538 RepID=UPI00244D479C|nr:hypothetical protein [Nocardioides sp. CER19]MDH2414896.1 hypothetical protein [Nocardioides sp. CER19]
MRVVVDRDGQATAAWEAKESADSVSLWTARRSSGGAWAAAEGVTTFSGFSVDFDLAVDGSGTTSIAWADTTDGTDIRAARRTRTGAWGSPVDLGSGHRPQFAEAAGGETILVWRGSSSVDVRRLDPGTGTWTSLPTLELSRLSSDVAVVGGSDAGRGLVVSWRDGYSSGGTVRVARLGADGWQDIGTSAVVEGSTWPRVGVDPTGRIVAGGKAASGDGVAGTLVTVGPEGTDDVPFELPGNDTTVVEMSATGEIVAAWHEGGTVFTAEYDAGRWSAPRRAHSARLTSTDVSGLRIQPLSDGRWLASWHQSGSSTAEQGFWTSLRDADGRWREEYAGDGCFFPDAVAAAPRGSIEVVGGCGSGAVVSRRLDVHGPTARMLGGTPLLPTYQTGIGATATDDIGGVGVAGFEYLARSVGWNGGPWTGWSPIGTDGVHTDGNSVIDNPTERPGRTYCARVRAVDGGGNVGPLSTDESCYSVPIDDRQMRRSRGWHVRTNHYWQHTALVTRKRGATLRMPAVRARRFALLADAMPRGGRVEVRFGGRLLKRVTLRSASVNGNDYRNIPLGVLPAARSGTLVIKVISTGRPVQIDGIHATPL